MTKEARVYNGGKTASLVGSVGKTEWSWTTYTRYKNKTKGIKDVNVKLETVKHLEVTIGSVLLDTGLRNFFFLKFVSTGKRSKSKNRQMGLQQAKSLLHSKGNHSSNVKPTYWMGEDVHKWHIQ